MQQNHSEELDEFQTNKNPPYYFQLLNKSCRSNGLHSLSPNPLLNVITPPQFNLLRCQPNSLESEQDQDNELKSGNRYQEIFQNYDYPSPRPPEFDQDKYSYQSTQPHHAPKCHAFNYPANTTESNTLLYLPPHDTPSLECTYSNCMPNSFVPLIRYPNMLIQDPPTFQQSKQEHPPQHQTAVQDTGNSFEINWNAKEHGFITGPETLDMNDDPRVPVENDQPPVFIPNFAELQQLIGHHLQVDQGFDESFTERQKHDSHRSNEDLHGGFKISNQDPPECDTYTAETKVTPNCGKRKRRKTVRLQDYIRTTSIFQPHHLYSGYPDDHPTRNLISCNECNSTSPEIEQFIPSSDYSARNDNSNLVRANKEFRSTGVGEFPFQSSESKRLSSFKNKDPRPEKESSRPLNHCSKSYPSPVIDPTLTNEDAPDTTHSIYSKNRGSQGNQLIHTPTQCNISSVYNKRVPIESNFPSEYQQRPDTFVRKAITANTIHTSSSSRNKIPSGPTYHALPLLAKPPQSQRRKISWNSNHSTDNSGNSDNNRGALKALQELQLQRERMLLQQEQQSQRCTMLLHQEMQNQKQMMVLQKQLHDQQALLLQQELNIREHDLIPKDLRKKTSPNFQNKFRAPRVLKKDSRGGPPKWMKMKPDNYDLDQQLPMKSTHAHGPQLNYIERPQDGNSDPTELDICSELNPPNYPCTAMEQSNLQRPPRACTTSQAEQFSIRIERLREHNRLGRKPPTAERMYGKGGKPRRKQVSGQPDPLMIIRRSGFQITSSSTTSSELGRHKVPAKHYPESSSPRHDVNNNPNTSISVTKFVKIQTRSEKCDESIHSIASIESREYDMNDLL